ncbi:hypothetical protein TNCV_3671361 [Trichonephila clavipes]|nr:hypothetical protein TNCV_3671361 [Trichonephila clavipes]
MNFTEINSRGERRELLGHIDKQNCRFRAAKTTIIKFGLHASFVELESGKSALNEVIDIRDLRNSHGSITVTPLTAIMIRETRINETRISDCEYRLG